jgi:hypothetical protein
VAAIGIFDRHAVADPTRAGVTLLMRLHLMSVGLRLIMTVHAL